MLQGIKLGPNVRAVTDLSKVVDQASVLVFVTPHQFVTGVIKQMKVGTVECDAEAGWCIQTHLWFVRCPVSPTCCPPSS